MNLEEVKTKYFMFMIFSIIVSATIVIFGNSLIPLKYTQFLILKDPTFSQGLHENILDLEKNIQNGQYKLVDNVPFLVKTQSYHATVTRTVESRKGTPSTKYRLEMRFRYPYSEISRYTKLDAILVDVNPEQNHQFADLFWNLE